jgi:hypothetical protein
MIRADHSMTQPQTRMVLCTLHNLQEKQTLPRNAGESESGNNNEKSILNQRTWPDSRTISRQATTPLSDKPRYHYPTNGGTMAGKTTFSLASRIKVRFKCYYGSNAGLAN